ncbi:DNA polymerase III subunit gamma/tau, partial [Spirulina subsalsa FACHB-351]|nr:DNA polymerase III subunit gamma/tau [Spirulina subsalsa FACHB-351]
PPAQPTPSTPETEAEILQQRIQLLWQQILDHLPSLSRALLQQHCTILNFDLEDCVAYLSVPTPGLLNIAEKQIKDVEIAFEKVFHQKIKVQLQVRPKSPPPASPSPRKVTPSPVSPPSPPPPAPEPHNGKGNGHNFSNPVNQSNGSNPPILPPKTPPSSPPTPPVITTTEEDNDEDDEDIKQALQKVLKMFSGEVLNLEQEILPPNSATGIVTDDPEFIPDSDGEGEEPEDMPF